MSSIQIIDRDVEEALVLRVVQVHGDDVVGAGAGEQVGDEGARLRHPLPIATLGAEVGGMGVVVVVGVVG